MGMRTCSHVQRSGHEGGTRCGPQQPCRGQLIHSNLVLQGHHRPERAHTAPPGTGSAQSTPSRQAASAPCANAGSVPGLSHFSPKVTHNAILLCRFNEQGLLQCASTLALDSYMLPSRSAHDAVRPMHSHRTDELPCPGYSKAYWRTMGRPPLPTASLQHVWAVEHPLQLPAQSRPCPRQARSGLHGCLQQCGLLEAGPCRCSVPACLSCKCAAAPSSSH